MEIQAPGTLHDHGEHELTTEQDRQAGSADEESKDLHLLCLKPGTHYMISGILNATTRPHPNKYLKYLKDATNERKTGYETC